MDGEPEAAEYEGEKKIVVPVLAPSGRVGADGLNMPGPRSGLKIFIPNGPGDTTRPRCVPCYVPTLTSHRVGEF